MWHNVDEMHGLRRWTLWYHNTDILTRADQCSKGGKPLNNQKPVGGTEVDEIKKKNEHYQTPSN